VIHILEGDHSECPICHPTYARFEPAPDEIELDLFLEAYWLTHSTPVIRQLHPEYRQASNARARELLAVYREAREIRLRRDPR